MPAHENYSVVHALLAVSRLHAPLHQILYKRPQALVQYLAALSPAKSISARGYGHDICRRPGSFTIKRRLLVRLFYQGWFRQRIGEFTHITLRAQNDRSSRSPKQLLTLPPFPHFFKFLYQNGELSCILGSN